MAAAARSSGSVLADGLAGQPVRPAGVRTAIRAGGREGPVVFDVTRRGAALANADSLAGTLVFAVFVVLGLVQVVLLARADARGRRDAVETAAELETAAAAVVDAADEVAGAAETVEESADEVETAAVIDGEAGEGGPADAVEGSKRGRTRRRRRRI